MQETGIRNIVLREQIIKSVGRWKIRIDRMSTGAGGLGGSVRGASGFKLSLLGIATVRFRV